VLLTGPPGQILQRKEHLLLRAVPAVAALPSDAMPEASRLRLRPKRQHEHVVQLVARLLHPRTRNNLDALDTVVAIQSAVAFPRDLRQQRDQRRRHEGSGLLRQNEAAFFLRKLEEELRHRKLGRLQRLQTLDQNVAASFLRMGPLRRHRRGRPSLDRQRGETSFLRAGCWRRHPHERQSGHHRDLP
jgi:hypothetical protein